MISRRILSLQGSRLVRSASLRSAEIRPGGSRSYPPKLFQLRSLSNQQQKQAAEEASKESAELVLTPGQKVVAGTRLTMYAGFAALAAVSAYFIGKELLPSRMSPNSVFDQVSIDFRALANCFCQSFLMNVWYFLSTGNEENSRGSTSHESIR